MGGGSGARDPFASASLVFYLEERDGGDRRYLDGHGHLVPVWWVQLKELLASFGHRYRTRPSVRSLLGENAGFTLLF